jgi:hypothetical protein
MLADALQDVDQVVVGIDVVQPASGQQALDDTDVFGAQLGPRGDGGSAPIATRSRL